MKKIKDYLIILVPLSALIICYGVWPIVASLSAKEIQPIASAVSTISGVLFGFVMASITLFASAKDNTLVRNTMLTQHLPKLVNKLHWTMGALLLVCLIFLVVLFLPDSLTFQISESENRYRYSSAVSLVGIFFLINSFFLFFSSWISFKNFAAHM